MDLTRQLQSLMNRFPLYQFIDADKRQTHLLVLGWNDAAAAFVDQALTAGQFPEHQLCVSVHAPDPDSCWLSYLEARPALSEFVCVSTADAPETPGADCYGILTFAPEIDKAQLSALLSQQSSPQFRYVFIATGCTKLNRSLAEVCEASTDCGNSHLVICAENDRLIARTGDETVIFTGEDTEDDELTHMAFRVHLLWANQQKISDYEAERRRFFDPETPYDLLSSRAYALSVRYKLWSAGIHETDPDLAAAAFSRLLEADTEHRLFNQLCAAEHRRWVMEKVTQGYTGLYRRGDCSGFEVLLRQGTLRVEGQNVCILHSTPETPLKTPHYQQKNHTAWDEPSEQDDQLDDLDRMSIDLHRFMRSKAQTLAASHYLDQPTGAVAQLSRLTEQGDVILRREWNRFLYCLHAILDGSRAYAKRFVGYREDIQQAFLDVIPTEEAQVDALLRQITADMFPAIEAAQYHNFKSNDEVLISGIPFVLTYRSFSSLALPFNAAFQRADVNDAIFDNLASPVVVKPGRLLYLHYAQRFIKPSIWLSMLEACLDYLKKNRIPCRVSLALSLSNEVSDSKRKTLQTGLERLMQAGKLAGFAIDEADVPMAFFADQLQAHRIDSYDGTIPLFSSMLDNMRWTEKRLAEGSYFEINTATKQITANPAGTWLTYIRDQSALSINDMFGLMHAENRDHHYPDLTDMVCAGDGTAEPLYLHLWRCCCGELTGKPYEYAVYAWNQVCDALDENNSRLKQAGALSEGKVDIARLFPDALSAPTARGKGTGTNRSRQFSRAEAIEVLLAIADTHTPDGRYFIELVRDPATNATYLRVLDPRICDVLGSAGAILEVYAYFCALETGYFDDLACSYTFYWGDHHIPDSHRKNELDLVLTKGFRSMLVECKARKALEQDFYHKLNSLADLFGINARKVMIANSYSTGAYNVMNDIEQIARGELMDVSTIHDHRQLKQLGTHLKELMQRM